MPSSPPRAASNGGDNSYHTFDIERFLADQQQYHPGFGKVQSPAEAGATAEARMMAELRTFEKQFGSSDRPSSS
ncbi:hypothetical protein THAR02_09125 [Trichoderma harzianum]|uniref:Uncharacterized protein n=1 Tax=Trichoderma harzianum TaxID=5544 RepID=A0A0F9X0E0_TRIHA|nr:hypothetical protein THAR02_09125 [Trichoderma harzianum]